ncbi:hypothetical protein CTAYLR_005165 [Chrysophaeum taylorii]|uniref:Ketoreductase domain-containing protein n=1 Tax=Chrysophaeum taylorii TaxID=2483200 RepID=A0AAD7XQQ0_9STRA|nr:hypothetical protein CTAYLR_005165 [Chrysophaeum taylorii]
MIKFATTTVWPLRRVAVVQGKTVVITGASQGIGRGVALKLAALGASVVVVARSEDKLEELVAEIRETGGEARAIACDCSDPAAVEAADFGAAAPWMVVHCAGAGRFRFLTEAEATDIKFCLDAPFLAAAHVTRKLLPGMLKTGGRLVFVQSPCGICPIAGATSYASARWALQGLFESLDADCAGSKLKPQLVVLGETHSNYFSNNPGSRDRIPPLSRLLTGAALSVDEAADAVIRAVASGSRIYYAPFMLHATTLLYHFFPPVVRFLLRRTSRVDYRAMINE